MDNAEFCTVSTLRKAERCNGIFLRRGQNAAMTDDIVPTLKRKLAELVDRLKAEGRASGAKDLSLKAGLTESTIRQAISTKPGNTGSMTMENYIKLARYLGCTVSDLIGEDAPRNDVERALLRAFREFADASGAAQLDLTSQDLRLLMALQRMSPAQRMSFATLIEELLGPAKDGHPQ